MPEKPDIAALLGARICHDLISPIGAISNGVELLIMDGATHGPEIALISESVAGANARIRFFRIAFGSGAADQRITRAEAQAVLGDLTRGGRLTIDWQSPADLPRREVKLAFLLIQCLETAMAFGGRITVAHQDGRWTLTGVAPRMKIDPALWEMLANPAAANAITSAITPAQVHFLLVPDEAARQGRRPTADIRDGEIRLGF